MTSLAIQLAEHPRWEWHGGMRYRSNGRRYLYTGCSFPGGMDAGCAPDLDDPATKGWLLAMLREATGDDFAGTIGAIFPHQETPEWFAWANQGQLGSGTTEGEALARALLAAWNAEEVPRG